MPTPKVPGRLQLRADELGLSQTAIGVAVGRDQSTIQRWFALDQVPAKYQAAVTQLSGGFNGPTLRLRLTRAGTGCSGRIQFLNGSNYALTTCALTRP